ncbi:MAG: RNA-binding protein [Paracoccaceae bacterium]|nr:RNA-binding protein [Paracoccaceae bacterium]
MKKGPAKIIERRCISTGSIMNTKSMVRFVVGPDGGAVPDVFCKLPGKGMWVSSKKSSLDRALSKNLFSVVSKKPVLINNNLSKQIEDSILKKLLNLISLARKANQAIAGFEKVKGSLETDRAVLLIQASDGSPREKSRLRPPIGDGTLINCLKMQELGLAFGRESVIHAAIMRGGLHKEITLEALRLGGIREIQGHSSAQKERTIHERQ